MAGVGAHHMKMSVRLGTSDRVEAALWNEHVGVPGESPGFCCGVTTRCGLTPRADEHALACSVDPAAAPP